MNWPDAPTAYPLGDDRYAPAADRPADIEALRQTVARRVAAGEALYPQGGRTALDYGEIPSRPGVVVDTTGLDRVIDYPAADMTITVEAGLTLARLQDLLGREGQRLPLDAPHPDRATLGGLWATNWAGPRRFGAGRPRDLILGVSFVTSDGELVSGGGRVVKNVAGYDFPRLLTGSMGALGVIASMTLKVRPRPEATALAWTGFDRLDDVATALDRLNTSRTRPVAIELLNGPAAQSVGAPLGLPAAPWVVVVGLEDNATAVAWQLEALPAELAPGRFAAVDGPVAGDLWTALAGTNSGAAPALAITANLPPSAVPGFVGELDSGLWTVQAHAGSGIVRADWTGAVRGTETVTPLLAGLRASAVQAGGNLILTRCPTAWKPSLPVWGEPRADWSVMQRLKRALDPAGLMNPGRFVGTI